MNFLAHFYFDRQHNDPYFNLGLLFPDLLRNFVKGARYRHGAGGYAEHGHLSLESGCGRHIASDKIFHQWEGFTEGMELASAALRTSEEPFRRVFFISHIFVELVMDKMLLNRFPDLANELYSDYERIDEDVIRRYLTLMNVHETEQFISRFERFMEVRYLCNYREYPNIVYALGRICTKMGLDPFTEYQKEHLEGVARQVEDFEWEKIDELEKILREDRV